MRLSKYKTYSKNFKHLLDINELEIFHPSNNKRINLVKDVRSFINEKGYWCIYPIAESHNEYYIVCPYCGEIHHHGKSPGHRSEHCREHKEYNRKGYIILEPKAYKR